MLLFLKNMETNEINQFEAVDEEQLKQAYQAVLDASPSAGNGYLSIRTENDRKETSVNYEKALRLLLNFEKMNILTALVVRRKNN